MDVPNLSEIVGSFVLAYALCISILLVLPSRRYEKRTIKNRQTKYRQKKQLRVSII